MHQLRHSALTHDAEDGTSAPMLMTKSGHASIRTLAKYARPGTEALARWQQETDPNAGAAGSEQLESTRSQEAPGHPADHSHRPAGGHPGHGDRERGRGPVRIPRAVLAAGRAAPARGSGNVRADGGAGRNERKPASRRRACDDLVTRARCPR